MPDPIGSAYVEITSNIAALQREIAGLKSHVDASARNMETRFNSATKAIAGLGMVIGGIGVVKFGTDIIAAATKMDQLNRMLLNVEGSQAAANKRFEQFRILAKEPVLDPFNLSKYYVGLRSVNIEAELSIRFMKSLANAMAGVGAGNEQFSNVMYQFVQMGGATKLLGQDLRVINESFPQMRKFLIEIYGSADPEKLAKEGHTSVEIFEKLTSVFEKLPHFLGGAKAAQENFTQSLQLFYAALGKDVLPTISDFLTKLTNLMDKFGELSDPMKKFIGTSVVGGIGLLGIASAVGAITTALNLLSVSSGLKALTSLGPIGIGAAAIGGISIFGKYQMDEAMKPINAKADVLAVQEKAIKRLEDAYKKTKEKGLDPYLVGVKEIQDNRWWDVSPITQVEQAFGKGKLSLESFGDMLDSAKSKLDENRIAYWKLQEGIIEPRLAEFQKPSEIKGANFESLVEEAKKFTDITSKQYKASDIEQLSWWQAKLGVPLTDEAKTGVLNTISGLQDDINKILKEKADEREKIWFEHAEATAKQTVYEYTPNMIPIIPSITGPQIELAGRREFPGQKGIIEAPLDKSFLKAKTDWTKYVDIKGRTQNAINEATDDAFKKEMDNIFHLTEAEQEAQDKRIANYDYIMGKIDKVSKKQSQFWLDMKSFATSAMDTIADKSISSAFEKMFSGSNIKEAYKDYLSELHLARVETERTGRTFQEIQLTYDEFAHDYRIQNKLNSESWSEFCKGMLEDFTKMLVNMELEAEAKNVFDILTGKKTSGEGLSSIISKLGGGKSEEIAGGISTGESIASAGITAGALATTGAIVGTVAWAYKVGEAGYDYWKQKQEFQEQISTPEGLTKTQLAQKDMIQQKWNIGKYENPEEGVYANVKGYEDSMKKLGLEPYPLAKGGSGIVTKPTIFMMGEKGPESFNIQPLSKGNTTNRSDNFVVNISFPNATLDSVDQNQIDRFISKAIPSLRRAVSNGELS